MNPTLRRLLRSSLLWIHRWFGLTFGFYFVLLGLSGCYLVYDETFEAWLNPSQKNSSAEGAPLDLPSLVAAAQKGLGTDKPPMSISIPADPSRNVALRFNLPRPPEMRRFLTAYVDPATNEFKGEENFRETVAGWMFIFHHELFLGGRVGRPIVAVAGALMLVILLTGLYLWWPRSAPGALRRSLTWPRIRNALHLHLELHRLSGFYSLVLMIAVTFSGIYIAKPDWFGAGRARGPGGGGGEKKEFTPINFTAIGTTLAQTSALARPLQLRVDANKNLVQATAGEEETRLELAGKDGALLKKETGAQPFSMPRLQHQIHAGEFWGELGRALVFLSGLLPLLFYVTGIYLWWKKRQKKKRAKSETRKTAA